MHLNLYLSQRLGELPYELSIDDQSINPLERENLKQSARAHFRRVRIPVRYRVRAIIALVISASSIEKSKAPSALNAPMVTTACSALKRAICSIAKAPVF
jgi:hypothetical protein